MPNMWIKSILLAAFFCLNSALLAPLRSASSSSILRMTGERDSSLIPRSSLQNLLHVIVFINIAFIID